MDVMNLRVNVTICFQLCQVGVTALALEVYGADKIPLM